jgi:hypothetical protein
MWNNTAHDLAVPFKECRYRKDRLDRERIHYLSEPREKYAHVIRWVRRTNLRGGSGDLRVL